MTVALSRVPLPDSVPQLTSSLESLSIHDTHPDLRARTLETIRAHFPLIPLFTPENKIDLGKFIESQMLFRKITELFSTLPPTAPVDNTFVARLFEKSDLLVEIKALFPQVKDPTPYLDSLFEACADVLNKKTSPQILFNRAMWHHISTLRDALVVLQKPEEAKEELSQEWHRTLKAKGWIIPSGGDPHFAETVKKDGESFIRECLRIHLLKDKVFSTFKAELTSTAQQLIPFVRDITKMHLDDYEKECPDDPLSFRNPTGYNFHGLTAATIMEVCLHVLGFTTQVMVRFDLEPKVTLATAHSIVQITAPDGSRYLVDPCYIQFHMDICWNTAYLPRSPVLVLREDEVDTYIEEKLMVHYVQNAALVKRGVESVIKKLSAQDQIIAYLFDDNDPHANPEERVRNGLKRVWDLESYTPVRANGCFQRIFVGNPESYTHAQIAPMGIAPLCTQYLPEEEVEKRLMQLLHDPKLKGQNSREVLSLIALLPTAQRDKYAPLLDLDPRIQDNLDTCLNAYFRALKKIVNPNGKDLRVFYPCSGADGMSVMLATDAKDYRFVDLTLLSSQDFASALTQMKDTLSEKAIHTTLEQSDRFLWYQKNFGGAKSTRFNGKAAMKDLALKFFFHLKCLGVDLDKVTLAFNENEVRVDFPWQYYGAASPRDRSITFVSADITDPKNYPPLLNEILKNGFDIFYMKAALFVPVHYPQFLPQIAKSIRPGGWLMTTEKLATMEEVSSEKCLEQNGLPFELRQYAEKKLLEDILIQEPESLPFYSPDSLDKYPKDRDQRTVTTDVTYWSILKLRRRMA